MNSVTLLMIIAITAATSIFCNDGIISRDSVVFSITSHGRLLGELLFVALKDVVGDCLYACMDHARCSSISYHQSSKRCELMADVLFKKDIIDDPGWKSYGHFESSLVSFFENYILLCNSHRYSKNRSSHLRCSVKKGVLKNFAKFTGKHLSQSLVFNKVAVLRSSTLLKKKLWHRCFPVNLEKFLRIPYFIENTSIRLLFWRKMFRNPSQISQEKNLWVDLF